MAGNRKISVVIVTYNSATVLPALLDSLAPAFSGLECFQVYVVDNESGDDSAGVAGKHPVAPTVIRMGRNAGYSAAINTAAAMSGPDSDLLILNPDIRLHPDTVRQMRDRLSDRGVGVVAPRIVHEDGALAFSARREPSIGTAWSEALFGGQLASRLGLGEVVTSGRFYDRGGPLAWATGAVLLISADARKAVGHWDESYFLYSEEVDYLRRVREAGFTIVYAPEASATHIGGESNSDPALYALLTANRIRYYRRYHGWSAATMFHLGVALGEAIRAGQGPTHRAALHAAVTMPPASVQS